MADIVPGEAWRWVESPNHGGPRPRTLGVMIHSTRGGTATLEQEYQVTVRYCSRPNASSVGPHFVVGPAEVTRMIHDDITSWCQTIDNDTHLSVEVAQPTRTTPFTDWQYAAAADLCAKWAKVYGFPLRHIGRQTTINVEVPGILGHDESRAGWSRGKTDPGPMWDWTKFMSLCQATYDMLYPSVDWSDIRPELRAYMEAEGLVPRPEHALRFRDPATNEYVWYKPRAGAPTGGIAMWRKSIDKCYHWAF